MNRHGEKSEIITRSLCKKKKKKKQKKKKKIKKKKKKKKKNAVGPRKDN